MLMIFIVGPNLSMLAPQFYTCGDVGPYTSECIAALGGRLGPTMLDYQILIA